MKADKLLLVVLAYKDVAGLSVTKTWQFVDLDFVCSNVNLKLLQIRTFTDI